MTVLVTAVGEAEGARGAAAALACAGADLDCAALLVDVAGRAPRPTLLASAAAQKLERRLAAHLPQVRVAARGQVCHLAVGAEDADLDAACAALTVGRDGAAVLHVPPAQVQSVLAHRLRGELSGALLRADLGTDRPLTALVVRNLRERGLTVKVLKQRLGWVAERRALFGALPADGGGGIPGPIAERLLSHGCYIGLDHAKADPARTAQQQRGDHARAGSR